MKIALYELYKALKSKVLLILFVALFLLNLALSATYTPVLGVPDECIREINKVYLSTSEEEKLSVAESIANKYIKDNVLQNIFPDKKYEDKLNRVKNYNTTKQICMTNPPSPHLILKRLHNMILTFYFTETCWPELSI